VWDVVGINEAISVPSVLAEKRSMGLSGRVEHWRQDLDLLGKLGVRKIRVNTATSPHLSHWAVGKRADQYARSDAYFQLLAGQQIEPIVMIGPWPGNRTSQYTAAYVPEDTVAYQAYVQQVVERYDGDGEADAFLMERGVRFWEVDNEPDLHHRAPVGDKSSPDFLTPEQYAEVYALTAEAVRAADAEAVVLNGGLFDTARPSGVAYFRAVEAALAAREVPSFDALSVHAYFQDQDASDFFKAMDAAAQMADGRPIFVTETGAPSDGRKAWISEEWQAHMLALVLGEALARGIEGVYWQGLVGPPPGPKRAKGSPGGFASHPLHVATRDGDAARAKTGAAFLASWLKGVQDVPLSKVRSVALQTGRAVSLGDAGVFLYFGAATVPAGAQVETFDLGMMEDGVVSAPALISGMSLQN